MFWTVWCCLIFAKEWLGLARAKSLEFYLAYLPRSGMGLRCNLALLKGLGLQKQIDQRHVTGKQAVFFRSHAVFLDHFVGSVLSDSHFFIALSFGL